MADIRERADKLEEILKASGIAKYSVNLTDSEKQELNVEHGKFKLFRTVFSGNVNVTVFEGAKMGSANGTDLTDEEKTNNEDWGGNIWGIDGQTIADHMTKNAPDNLVFSASCKAMETDGFCQPLHDKGVAVIYGFSKSVTGTYGIVAAQTFMNYLGLGEMVSEAFADSKKEMGCDWDTQ